MKIFSKWLCLVTIVMAPLAFPVNLMAQDKASAAADEVKVSEADAELISAAKKTFAEIGELAEKQKWDDLKARMTSEAADQFAATLGFSLAMMGEAEEQGMGEMPGASEMFDKLDNVIETYDLVEIETLFEDFDGDQGEAEARILKLMDKDEKRWEIVDAIWSAQLGSPFQMEPLLGSVTESSLEEKTAFLTVKIGGGGDQESGMQIMAPPMIVKLENTKDGWVYGGVDDEKSEAAMEEFMEKMGGEMGGFDMSDLDPPIAEDASFSGETVSGDEISLADFKGKVVLVDFWGTWCKPCVAEIPKLELIHEKFQQHGFEIVGIAADEKADVEKFIEGRDPQEMKWKNILDAKGKLSKKFGISAYPTTLLIDKEGKHVASNLSKAELIDELVVRLGLKAEDFKELKDKFGKNRRRGGNPKH